MKTYQKAELIAKNLPTGSYAAGCPAYKHGAPTGSSYDENGFYKGDCSACEIAY